MVRSKKKNNIPIQRKIEYFVDNKPSSLMDIIENNPDKTVWKEYLEKNKLQNSRSAKRYLKEKLGDYLDAGEINKRVNIKPATLAKWREKGYLESAQLNGRWFYSLKSIINAIKTADAKDLK